VTGRRGPISNAKRALKVVPPVPPTAFTAREPPEHLGTVGAAIWREIWPAMPVLNPAIDAHEVARYCAAADDASRARAEIEKRGLLVDEAIADPRGGILGYRRSSTPPSKLFGGPTGS
jgi:phage terminase small subunit